MLGGTVVFCGPSMRAVSSFLGGISQDEADVWPTVCTYGKRLLRTCDWYARTGSADQDLRRRGCICALRALYLDQFEVDSGTDVSWRKIGSMVDSVRGLINGQWNVIRLNASACVAYRSDFLP